MVPIIRSADCTSRDAKEFLEKFIEINHVDKNLENTETCHAPKKKGSISEFKKALEVHETALKDWKYSVQVTLDMFKENMEKSIEITKTSSVHGRRKVLGLKLGPEGGFYVKFMYSLTSDGI